MYVGRSRHNKLCITIILFHLYYSSFLYHIIPFYGGRGVLSHSAVVFNPILAFHILQYVISHLYFILSSNKTALFIPHDDPFCLFSSSYKFISPHYQKFHIASPLCSALCIITLFSQTPHLFLQSPSICQTSHFLALSFSTIKTTLLTPTPIHFTFPHHSIPPTITTTSLPIPTSRRPTIRPQPTAVPPQNGH